MSLCTSGIVKLATKCEPTAFLPTLQLSLGIISLWILICFFLLLRAFMHREMMIYLNDWNNQKECCDRRTSCCLHTECVACCKELLRLQEKWKSWQLNSSVMAKEKTDTNIVVIGHVSSCKSTVTGHLVREGSC